MQSATTSLGIHYRYNKFVAGRSTLVFLHGLTGSSSSWREYEQAFDADYNICTIDLRGHGLSVKPREPEEYGIKHFARDVATVLEELQITRCIIVSHSFGTLVALELYLQRPEKVEKIFFFSPNYNLNSRWLNRLTNPVVNLLAAALSRLPLPLHAGKQIDYSKFPQVGDWDIALNIADIANTTLRVYCYCLQQISSAALDWQWPRVLVPTLIVHGKQDSIVPLANARTLAARMPRAKFLELENANHLFVLNNYRQTILVMRDFLTTN